MDVDATSVGAAGVAPDDCVVADDSAGRVVQRAHDRPGRAVGEIELRTELRDLAREDDTAVDSQQLVHLGTLGHRHHRPLGMCKRQVPLLGEEQVEVELGPKLLVELDAAPVERCALRRAVVRADDGRVSPRRSGTDVPLLEDRDVPNAVVAGEVVRGREPVRPAADDDDVVLPLELTARSPHPPDPEEIDHLSPSSMSRTASTTESPYSCGKKMRKRG